MERFCGIDKLKGYRTTQIRSGRHRGESFSLTALTDHAYNHLRRVNFGEGGGNWASVMWRSEISLHFRPYILSFLSFASRHKIPEQQMTPLISLKKIRCFLYPSFSECCSWALGDDSTSCIPRARKLWPDHLVRGGVGTTSIISNRVSLLVLLFGIVTNHGRRCIVWSLENHGNVILYPLHHFMILTRSKCVRDAREVVVHWPQK